jgi:YbbR domain-containing protein
MNKNIIKDNLGLKLLSVLIAIVIWYVVVEVNDPIETASFTVKVTVANETYIANGKQIYHIDDDYKTVTAYIKSNRSTLKKITADQITVTADLTQIVDIKREPVMVPLTASRQGINPANITLSRTAIPITI